MRAGVQGRVAGASLLATRCIASERIRAVDRVFVRVRATATITRGLFASDQGRPPAIILHHSSRSDAAPLSKKGKHRSKKAAADSFDDLELHPMMALKFLAHCFENDRLRSIILELSVKKRKVASNQLDVAAASPMYEFVVTGKFHDILGALAPCLQSVVDLRQAEQDSDDNEEIDREEDRNSCSLACLCCSASRYTCTAIKFK